MRERKTCGKLRVASLHEKALTEMKWVSYPDGVDAAFTFAHRWRQHVRKKVQGSFQNIEVTGQLDVPDPIIPHLPHVFLHAEMH